MIPGSNLEHTGPMKQITGNTYITPDGIKPCLREYLLLKSRWSPYSRFFQIVLKYRPLAVRGEYSDEIWAKSSLEVMEVLEECSAHFTITGLDHVRNLPGPAIFAANHMSTLETMLLPGLVVPIRPCTFVVKDKLVKAKIWGPVMRSRNPIVVTRKDPRTDLEAVLTQGSQLVAQGTSVIIFPQSTRTSVFVRSGFNSLAAKLAAKTGAYLVPVAVKTDYWGNSPILRGFGPVNRNLPVHIEFGEPMKVQGRGKAEHEVCLDFIEGRLKDWGAAIG